MPLNLAEGNRSGLPDLLALRSQAVDLQLDDVTGVRYGNRPETATPCGVPVLMMSPGSSTMYWLRWWMSVATEKTMSTSSSPAAAHR